MLKKQFTTTSLFILLLLLSKNTTAKSNIFPYISPGIEIGFGKHGANLTTKISVGVNLDDFSFVNITYGRAIPVKSVSPSFKNGYRFVEAEGGRSLYSAFIGGGGAGVVFLRDEKLVILPKVTLFAGALLFFRTDHIFYPKYKDPVIGSYGFMFVTPVSPLVIEFFEG